MPAMCRRSTSSTAIPDDGTSIGASGLDGRAFPKGGVVLPEYRIGGVIMFISGLELLAASSRAALRRMLCRRRSAGLRKSRRNSESLSQLLAVNMRPLRTGWNCSLTAAPHAPVPWRLAADADSNGPQPLARAIG